MGSEKGTGTYYMLINTSNCRVIDRLFSEALERQSRVTFQYEIGSTGAKRKEVETLFRMAAFRIIRATMSDRPRVASFLRAAYYNHEPLYLAVGLTKPIEADINHSLDCLTEGKTLLALSSKDKIVGIAINGEVTKNETEERIKLLDKCKCKDFALFLKFSIHLELVGKFWRGIGESKALDLGLLAVDPATRGQGVGKTLFSKSEELAEEVGYKVFRAICTSYYSAKLAEKQGMSCVFEMKYEDYRDESGEVVFKVPAPHDAIRAYVRKF